MLDGVEVALGSSGSFSPSSPVWVIRLGLPGAIDETWDGVGHVENTKRVETMTVEFYPA